MNPFVFIGSSFLLWRIVLFLLTAIAPIVIPIFGDRFPYRNDVLQNVYYENWFWPWGNFDGVHYLRIAKDGYTAEFSQVFFPLYPFFIRTFGNLFLDEYLAMGFLISNIAFFLSLIFLFKILSLDHPLDLARKAIIFLLIFPTAFFLGTIYTEGLFFLLIILSFYYARKNNFILASFFGFFASLTRFVGIFLFPALVLEYYLQNKKRLSFNLLWLLLIPAGLAIYMIYLGLEFSNPFYFLTAQPIFGAERSGGGIVLLPQVLWRYLKIFFSVDLKSLAFFNAAFEFVITIFVLGLLFWGIKKIRTSYLIFSFLAVFAPTLSGTLSSMPRYVLIAFPIFILLAQLRSFLAQVILVLVFIILGVFSIFLFTRGYWLA